MPSGVSADRAMAPLSIVTISRFAQQEEHYLPSKERLKDYGERSRSGLNAESTETTFQHNSHLLHKCSSGAATRKDNLFCICDPSRAGRPAPRDTCGHADFVSIGVGFSRASRGFNPKCIGMELCSPISQICEGRAVFPTIYPCR